MPKSLASKLFITLLLYAFIGVMACMFIKQPVFALSIYLHAMTLAFLGMFVAASAGEVLFNKEESDILQHRPISTRDLLWAKIAVLVEVSLWLAGAFNLVGFVVGIFAPNGGALYPVIHALSTALQALFCTGAVVMTYQLCLRWFGRERLEALMTSVQVVVALAAVCGGQLAPQLIRKFGGTINFGRSNWWIALLPPAWFAGLDDALAGSHRTSSLILATVGITATVSVLVLAFGTLVRSYEIGLQHIGESVARLPSKRRGRFLERLTNLPLLRWWLGDSVARASFFLTLAYLTRDRETKLRVYPGLAPMLILPIIMLVRTPDSGFMIAFGGAYLGVIPMMGINLLQYSQQWRAADLFRVAPVSGPAPFCHGNRRAVLFFLTLPALLLVGLVFCFMHVRPSQMALLLPGIIAIPAYAMVPCLKGQAVPLSMPGEEAKSAGRGLRMILVMFISLPLAGAFAWAWSAGFFWVLLAVEIAAVVIVYALMRSRLNKSAWSSLD
jgi:hypothetical protein